ncbi:HIT family protein [Macrococcus equi]|uniref:HIT family protein n=1 Tax=Macrococcus equi TaxID=3395462 RepID=UPI0039BE7675
MEDCIFCSIINDPKDSYVLYEDELTMVILDIANDVDGHSLVIPKQHYDNILDLDSEILNAIMKTVQKMSSHFIENLNYKGVNLLNANGSAADQSVNHFHIHLIPRRNNDGIDAWPQFEGSKVTLEEMYEYLKIND